MTANAIEKNIVDMDLLMLYGQSLATIAENNIGEIVIFEISMEDLINESNGYSADTCKEIGRVQYGDWEALEKIIGKEDTILEQEESQIYKEELITHYEACDECEKVCECHTISRTILYCEEVYVYSGTCHS